MARSLEENVEELTLAIGLLTRRLRSAAFFNELSWSETSVLAHLDRHGASTTAELSRMEGIKPQSMSTIISALEERGLVSRAPHPTDRRQVNIEITGEGRSLRAGVKKRKRTWLLQAVSQLSADEQKSLFAAAEVIKRIIDHAQED